MFLVIELDVSVHLSKLVAHGEYVAFREQSYLSTEGYEKSSQGLRLYGS